MHLVTMVGSAAISAMHAACASSLRGIVNFECHNIFNVCGRTVPSDQDGA